MRVLPPRQWLMVGCYHPYQLLRTRIAMTTSAIFGCYSDHQLIRARDQRKSFTSTSYTVATTVVLCLVVLAGCTRERTRLRYTSGLQPIPTANMVKQSTVNQSMIVEELKTRADLPAEIPQGSADWAVFVEAGFNFVDEECNQYLDSLFWFDRYRRTAQTQISLTGAATAAIMGITGAAAGAVAATAAAFGLLGATVDNLSNSVLYELEPSGIKTLVDRSRAQYRAATRERIKDEGAKNQPVAMSLIQSYLALCLPATIETEVNGAIGDTDFAEDKTADKSLVPKLRRVPQANLQVSISPELEANIARATRREPLQAVAPLPPTPTPRTGVLRATSDVEKALSLSTGKAVQEALCIEADGDFGDKTRDAIALYYAANDRLGRRVLQTTGDAGDLIKAGPCDRKRYRNAYERFRFPDPDKIKKLQERINIELKRQNLGQPIKDSGEFDPPTREAIMRIQGALGERATGEMRPELNPKIGVQ